MKKYCIGGSTYRVIGQWREDRQRGYETTTKRVNVLQKRFMWFWIDVAVEDVPAFAWIENACLGGTNWQSPLIARVESIAE